MKKNNLLKTVLLFLFAVLLLQGCRQENLLNEKEFNQNKNKSFRILKISDIPDVASFIKEKNKRNDYKVTFSKKSVVGKTSAATLGSIDTNFVVEKTINEETYFVFGVKNISNDPTVTYTLEVHKKNNIFIDAKIIEYNYISVEELNDLTHFTGTVSSYSLDGSISSSIDYSDGTSDCPDSGTSNPDDGTSSGGGLNDGGSSGSGTSGSSSGSGWDWDGGSWGVGGSSGGSGSSDPCAPVDIVNYNSSGQREVVGEYFPCTGEVNYFGAKRRIANTSLTPDCGDGSGVIILDELDFHFDKYIRSFLAIDKYNYLNLPENEEFRDGLKQYYANNVGQPNLQAFLSWAVDFKNNNTNTSWEQFQNWFLDGYSAQYQSNLTKLSSPQLLAFVNINKEIDASPYQEEFVKETNEMFVAFGDIDNLTEAKMIAILMLINPQYVKAMENTRMIIATYNFNRKFYPEWSKARCFWEASRESIQYMLDLGGLIPVAGEICDLTNAAIYTINGDGLNATLSYVSAIPIAGWFSTGAKFGVKVVNKTASHIASRQVLKWILGTDGIIKFGYRSQLRKVLQLTDAAKQAHHIIPWEFANNAIVQKAAKSAEAFHMNDILNGIPLPTTGHLTGHNLYNDKLNQILTNLNNSNPNMSANQAYNHILALTNQIKTLIKNNPTYNLGQIASLIKYP